MKSSTFLIAFLALLGYNAQSQSSFGVINHSHPNFYVSYLPSEFEVIYTADVENIGSSTVRALAKREIIQLNSAHFNQLCWGIECFPPSVDVATDDQTIAMGPGAIETGFKGIIKPVGTAGLDIVKYCFFDTVNPSDSSCIMVHYDASWSIDENTTAKGTVSQAFPNPATERVSFGYDLIAGVSRTEFTMLNSMGQVLGSTQATLQNGVQGFDVSNLPNGIYFMQVRVDGDELAYRKFIVSR